MATNNTLLSLQFAAQAGQAVKAARDIGKTADTAVDKLNSALATAGGKRITAPANGLATIARNAASAQSGTDDLNRSISRTERRRLTRITSSVQTLGTATEAARAQFFSLRTAIAGIDVAVVGRNIVQAGRDFERLQSRMKLAVGSSEAVEKEFDFLMAKTDELGLSFEASAGGYTRFIAAAKGTSLEGEAAREVFSGLATAAAANQLSAEEMGGVMLAVEQIMSKGKVSAEELRGQLGERLPGAFLIAARAMGTTTSGLSDMLDNGELLSEDFLPRFAKELQSSFGDGAKDAADNVNAQFNRISTRMFLLNAEIARSGFLDGVASGLDDLTKYVAENKDEIIALGQSIGNLIAFAGRNAETIIKLAGAYLALKTAIAGASLASQGLKLAKGLRGGVHGVVPGTQLLTPRRPASQPANSARQTAGRRIATQRFARGQTPLQPLYVIDTSPGRRQRGNRTPGNSPGRSSGRLTSGLASTTATRTISSAPARAAGGLALGGRAAFAGLAARGGLALLGGPVGLAALVVGTVAPFALSAAVKGLDKIAATREADGRGAATFLSQDSITEAQTARDNRNQAITDANPNASAQEIKVLVEVADDRARADAAFIGYVGA